MESFAAWHDYFVAQVGASAALAGLLFVALSINIERIIKLPFLPARAAHTVLVLLGSLIEASVALWPYQPPRVFGWEIVGISAIIGYAAWMIAARHPKTPPEYDGGGPIFVPLVVLLSMGAGIALIVGWPWAMYALSASMIVAMMIGFINSWVLLVEILR